MNIKFRKTLLCIASVFMFFSAGAASAAGGNDVMLSGNVSQSSTEESDEEKKEELKRQESTEDVKLTEKDAERLLKKIGSVDGLDIYLKSDRYVDEIWGSHGGNPKDNENYDKNAEPTQEQLEAEAEIELLEKIGDYVAVDPKKGKAAASFEDGKKCDEGTIYLSDAGRYLLTVNEDGTKPVKIREIISTLDDPYLFRTADGMTLELMDESYKKLVTEYKYRGEEDGKLVFASKDGIQLAWLGTDMKSVLATVRYAAENNSYRMLVDDRTAIIGLENKETGYIWWSSPVGATRDEVATPLIINELRSSSVLRYGIPEKRSSHNYMRSASEECSITVSDISDGIRVVYDYKKAGIKYPVEYTIENDCLKASLKASEIIETNSANIATEITLLGSFGAASSDEDGYFVIPDGSGALIRFNNGKTFSNSYSQRVYGSDITAVPNNKRAVTEQIYLPAYGIVKEDNALLVVASKGDSNAVLKASVSEQSKSSYNLCNFTFILRATDSFYMSGSSKEELTVFESGKIKSDDIELRYYPISEKEADFVDVAEKYRNYLVREAGLSARTEAGSAPMYLDLYGGAEKQKSVLGIPVKLKTSFTGFSEAKSIVSALKEQGVEDMVVSYNNWTDNGIKNYVDTEAKPSGTLGGKNDFRALADFLEESGFEFYPSSDNRDFYSGNGYYSFTSTAVRASGAYSRILSYDRAYGVPDDFKKNMSLLAPDLFKEVFAEASENYADRGLSGMSLGTLTASLYGDYGKKNISRYRAMKLLSESYKAINEKLENGILADSANAYSLPYVSHITGVPVSSSRFDVFDEDVPFYQIALHGIIPYSTTAVNGSADPEKLLLMAAATGSNLSFDMIYEEASLLKDTEFDVYFYANYEGLIDTAAAEYKLLSAVLSGVSDSLITGYEVENQTLITTTYSNGTVIKVDLENKTIDCEGIIYKLSDYTDEGGIVF